MGLLVRILNKIFEEKNRKDVGIPFFTEVELIDMKKKNEVLGAERQEKIKIDSEFQKFSNEIDDFFYNKLVTEIDESIFDDFSLFCIDKLNSFSDIQIKKDIWKLIQEYVLNLYKYKDKDEIMIFLNSVKKRVLV